MNLPLIPLDKANHFLYGFFIYVFFSMFMAPEMAVGIVFGFGVLKEIIDHLKYKGADVVDLFFTVLPAIIITITENIKTWQ
jgi:sterol desaturase/sphingolipid hydroxylase (fatty acid hydroxylase superfamily)